MYISEKVLHRCEQNPIITPQSFPDAFQIFTASPVKYKDEYILLQPIHKLDKDIPEIYILRSKDGINFTIDERPFITRSEKYHDLDTCPIDPRVSYVPEDDMYYIFRPMTSSWGVVALLLRTKDFETVEEIGITSLPHNRVPCLFQGKINGRYARLDRPYGGGPRTSTGGCIWISYSDDLINWGGHTPLLTPWTNTSNKLGPTPPIKTKDGWLVIVHAVKLQRYSLFAVLLDLDDPSKVIAKGNSPILTPDEIYEYLYNVNRGGTVYANGALVDEAKDELRVYYGTPNGSTGLATGSLSELIELIKYEDANCEKWIWS